MPSYTGGYGTSQVIAQVRAKGDQAPITRVIDQTSGAGTSQIVIQFGKVLIYLEDYTALESLTAAVRRAHELAPKVFPEARKPRTT